MNNLYALRKKYHVNQAELAYYVGVNRMSISKIETNQQIPSLELAHKLACFFQVSIDDLFFSNSFMIERLPQKHKKDLLHDFINKEIYIINLSTNWHDKSEISKELERITSLNSNIKKVIV